MDLTASIAKVRRLINERSAVGGLWSDADITQEYNNALYEAEARVSLIAPGEFLKGATVDLVAGTTLYVRPTYEPMRQVKIRASASDKYKTIGKLTVEQMTDHVSGTSSQTSTRGTAGYALIGKYLYLLPAPSASVAAGFACLYHEKVGLTNPTDEPRMPAGLHHRICYRAALLCLKDSKDASDEGLAKLEAEWNYYFGDSKESRARLYQDHYYDRQPFTFTPTVVWSEGV